MTMVQFQSYLYSNFDVDNNNPAFDCRVTYKSKYGIVSASTNARMAVQTMDWGNISLTEVEELPNYKYHLDFNPQFQEMEFDETSSSLSIKGASQKMGDYHVTITPIGPAMESSE